MCEAFERRREWASSYCVAYAEQGAKGTAKEHNARTIVGYSYDDPLGLQDKTKTSRLTMQFSLNTATVDSEVSPSPPWSTPEPKAVLARATLSLNSCLVRLWPDNPSIYKTWSGNSCISNRKVAIFIGGSTGGSGSKDLTCTIVEAFKVTKYEVEDPGYAGSGWAGVNLFYHQLSEISRGPYEAFELKKHISRDV
jgi:hypothetical protein